jgi:hypothetical protein
VLNFRSLTARDPICLGVSLNRIEQLSRSTALRVSRGRVDPAVVEVAGAEALEDCMGFVGVDGHGGLVVRGVALGTEQAAGEVEGHVDGADGVPAGEATVGGDDGGKEVGPGDAVRVVLVVGGVSGGYGPFLGFLCHGASREERWW